MKNLDPITVQYKRHMQRSLTDAPGFLEISRNARGRDYFVGDLHGEGLLLEKALEAIGFDPACDRLFCTGDLVDRGDAHAELLDVLERIPGFHSVLGNHDVDALSQIWNIQQVADFFTFLGSKWLSDISPEHAERWRQLLRQFPLSLRVTLSDGRRVGLIHADLPKQLTAFEDLALLSLNDLPCVYPKTSLQKILMGRRRSKMLRLLFSDDYWMHPPVEEVCQMFSICSDVDLIVSGHSVCLTGRPVQLGKWLFLDTGAGYEAWDYPLAALSIVDLMDRRVVQAMHEKSGVIAIKELLLEDPIPLPVFPSI